MNISGIRSAHSLSHPPAAELRLGTAASSQLETRGRGLQSVAAAEPLTGPELGSRTTDPPATTAAKNAAELQETFQQFVGETFFGHLLSAMRKTVRQPAYFHGGRAEDVFQAQLDQTLSERMAQSTAESFSQPLFDLFTLARSQ